jgi:preprotein translocase subunit SecF
MFWVSISLMAIAIIATFSFGLKLSVDFKGGSVLELQFKNRPATSDIQKALGEMANSTEISPTGDSGLILRSGELSEAKHQEIISNLNKAFPEAGLKELRFDSIGPIIGNELKQKSIVAIVLVLISVIIYIAFVFRKIGRSTSPWAMGISAIAALLHDIVIPVGVFAVLGHYMGIEISGVFVAAALTILGFSVSDTVIIFDRVRENITRGSKEGFAKLVHTSVMQTLARSLNTVFTVLLSLFAIYFFGGESIRYFSLALIIGIFLGAYSSIFVASPLLVWWTQKQGRG